MTLNTHLTHLQTTGLIQLAQEYPELEYLFRHVLVQDAAYESLLYSDRRHLHETVAETIVRAYPE
jgi:predicted ATPase